jgi:SAM-dependent methyltransferase
MDRDYFEYLKDDQYSDCSNLHARVQLHERYGRRDSNLHAWIFDGFLKQAGPTVLEVGCGPAYLWKTNLHRVPGEWTVTLTDLSIGMLRESGSLSNHALRAFRVLACDAQDLPFASASFDTAIANHMLYHLRDIDRGIDELSRVLTLDGVLFASTNGAHHMHEVTDLVHSLSDEVVFGSRDILEDPEQSFRMENGAEILGKRFSRVEWFGFDDELLVTESEPLVRYILSFPGNARDVFGPPAALARLDRSIRDRIEADGAFHITKTAGLFVARK